MKETLVDFYRHHKSGNVSDKWEIYLTEYDRIFLLFREALVDMLEIGVQNGGSLDIYAKYFTNAKNIIGCDINPKCADIKFTSQKITLVIGDINKNKTRQDKRY